MSKEARDLLAVLGFPDGLPQHVIRRLDGKLLTAHPLTFGRGRLSIGPDDETVTESW